MKELAACVTQTRILKKLRIPCSCPILSRILVRTVAVTLIETLLWNKVPVD